MAARSSFSRATICAISAFTQAVIGIQMSSAYVGNLAMPPLFGLLANNITPALFPFYLLVFLVLMALMHRQLVRKTAHI